MHELAITQNMLDVVLEEAKQASRITRISLVVGELSGVEADCVQFYFDFLKKDNAAEEASLDFKLVPAQLRCRDCQVTFNPGTSLWVCPDCRSSNVEIIDGRDCYVESIEVE